MTDNTTGAFAWNELASTDPNRARAFYADVLGWSFEAFQLPGGAYWVARSGDRLVGGIGDLSTGPPGTSASAWVCWLDVDDVDARVARVHAAGGLVIQSPHDVPNVGRVAVIQDPTGGVIGLMKGQGS